jgi:hypothetical protein
MIRPADVQVYYDISPQAADYRSAILECSLMKTVLLTKEEQRSRRIDEIRDGILRNPDWLNLVKEKAAQKNIPLDSMITLDAIYVFEEEMKIII